jgi:hypothetical protein
MTWRDRLRGSTVWYQAAFAIIAVGVIAGALAVWISTLHG